MKPILAALLVLPAAALADSVVAAFRSDAGQDYGIEYVEGGFTFRAMRPTEEAIAGETVRGVELIHLLPTCEARREFLPELAGGPTVASTGPVLAAGNWGWTDDGFEADFPGLGIHLPRHGFWPSGDIPCRR